jgi:hypothetical protein
VAISLLHGCCQIETSARDLAAVRSFMVEVLGAGPIEQELAAQIARIVPDDDYRIDHIDCGQAVFQVNQPAPGMTYNNQKSTHQAYLDSIGPCVTNLNFFIDDHRHAHELLTGMGAETRITGPSSAARALADYGLDNTRPGADERPFLFMGTRQLIGLDLEIMEPNFLRFSEQTAQYPAFVQPRPQTGDGNLLLQRLRLVVPDLDETQANLERIFTPGSRSKPYAFRAGSQGKAFRIGLCGIELEYCQPLGGGGKLAELLDRYGPGVVTIEFAARDPQAVLDRCRTSVAEEPDLLGIANEPGRWQIASRDLLGFDVVLEPE